MNSAKSIKGRGTASNPDSRFHSQGLEPVSDGWWTDADERDSIITELIPEQSKSIISSNQSPDVPFDRSINPYRGCEHGCVYCYARPTHAYWDMSPGLDFETRIIYKTNAANLLVKQFENPRYQVRPICIGANTDPYQPIEKKLRITRKLLELMHAYQHPVMLITKGSLLARDLDLLKNLAEHDLCSVAISVTTLDNRLKRILEPRAASGATRLKLVEKLSSNDIPVTTLYAPVIPCINDHEMESIIKATSDAGARHADYILLRLPFEVKTLFIEWLETHYPLKAKHVLSIIMQCRDGKAYDSDFGSRMSGAGAYANMLKKRFELACRRNRVNGRQAVRLNCELFRRGNKDQLTLV